MSDPLATLQTRHRRCHRCVDAGFIPAARPVFSGAAGQRVLLVGQAPGPVEVDEHRPFAGRAGRQLMRWFQRAGFEGEDDVRQRIYMTSMTTCFPGRNTAGDGDRRPSAREVALCSPWLDAVLELLQPRIIIPVGSLALTRFLPAQRLDGSVGRAFAPDGAEVGVPPPADLHQVLLPFPHPSGQSRWLNDPSRAALLGHSLVLLRDLLGWAL